MKDGDRIVRYGSYVPGDDPRYYVRATDAQAITERVDGYLKGIDLNVSAVNKVDQHTVEVQSLGSREVVAWVRDGETPVANYQVDRNGHEYRRLFGATPVAHSPIRATLVSDGVDENVGYRLREEVVEDPHRINVVRQGLGLVELG